MSVRSEIKKRTILSAYEQRTDTALFSSILEHFPADFAHIPRYQSCVSTRIVDSNAMVKFEHLRCLVVCAVIKKIYYPLKEYKL